MSKFDIGAFAASLNQAVAGSSSDALQIQTIDIDLLDSHEGNFYDVSNLDTLADSIAMDGLQQPVVVMPSATPGRYTVLSGHRRTAAIRKLLQEDEHQHLRSVPCIIRQYKSQALAELQLILANSTARVLTSAETMMQAQKIEELFYRLKEEGYAFPGRMRDQVAAACQVSASKLARLKVIQDGLISDYMALFKASKLPENTAYMLARLPAELQQRIHKVCKDLPPARNAERLIELSQSGVSWNPSLTCPDGSACRHGDAFLRHDCECFSGDMCQGAICCLNCSRAKSSYSPCERMCSKAKALRKDKRDDEKEQEAKKRETEQVKRRAAMQASAQRLVAAADQSGVPDSEKIHTGSYSYSISVGDLRKFAAGEFGDRYLYENELAPGNIRYAADIATTLGCSADYVLGLTDELSPRQASAPDWQRGTPAENGYYWAICKDAVNCGKLVWWENDHWEFSNIKMEMNIRPQAWMKCSGLPDWAKWERKAI